MRAAGEGEGGGIIALTNDPLAVAGVVADRAAAAAAGAAASVVEVLTFTYDDDGRSIIKLACRSIRSIKVVGPTGTRCLDLDLDPADPVASLLL